jgi:hypothetical protein
MKAIFSKKEMEEWLEPILKVGESLYNKKEGEAFLETIINYLFFAGELEPEIIIDTISKISEKGENKIMSTATKLMERGESIGLRKGRMEAYQRLVSKGFSPEEAKQLLGMD